jgi:hypothetical protein
MGVRAIVVRLFPDGSAWVRVGEGRRRAATWPSPPPRSGQWNRERRVRSWGEGGRRGSSGWGRAAWRRTQRSPVCLFRDSNQRLPNRAVPPVPRSVRSPGCRGEDISPLTHNPGA